MAWTSRKVEDRERRDAALPVLLLFRAPRLRGRTWPVGGAAASFGFPAVGGRGNLERRAF